jgi:bifunctional ADP-heptose synthase (sugar kinase/adenylyltransferase)
MKIAIVGDSFTDRYVYGSVNRISPEAPIPILDVERTEDRGGGAINVANNLHALGISPTLFTITDMELPYEVVSPKGEALVKTRFIGNDYQLLRADKPIRYRQEDLDKMIYPEGYDLVAFVDYNKGIIKGGKADIVDTKKKDLSVFWESDILKINQAEYLETFNNPFKRAFITMGKDGINYYQDSAMLNSPTQAQSVIDVTGAGDTVMATLIYCLASGITDPREMMRLANKAAGIVVGKFGTAVVTLKELYDTRT